MQIVVCNFAVSMPLSLCQHSLIIQTRYEDTSLLLNKKLLLLGTIPVKRAVTHERCKASYPLQNGREVSVP